MAVFIHSDYFVTYFKTINSCENSNLSMLLFLSDFNISLFSFKSVFDQVYRTIKWCQTYYWPHTGLDLLDCSPALEHTPSQSGRSVPPEAQAKLYFQAFLSADRHTRLCDEGHMRNVTQTSASSAWCARPLWSALTLRERLNNTESKY